MPSDAAIAPDMHQMAPSTDPYAAVFGGASSQAKPHMGVFVLSTGRHVATYRWKADVQKRGVIVLVHGFAEHLGRYNHVAAFFTQQGFEVCGADHLAHGRSEGFRGSYGKLPGMTELARNLSEFVLAEVAPLEGPHYIYSHSTGGTVTFLALEEGLQHKWPNMKAVIYSAPLVRQEQCLVQPAYLCPSCTLCSLGCVLGCCGTCCAIPAVELKTLTSYEPAVAATGVDPMYFGKKANATMIKALFEGTVMTQKRLPHASYPFLVMVSPTDPIVSPKAAKALFERAASQVKAFESEAFAGYVHELHNHEDWRKPLQISLEWLTALPGQGDAGSP